MWIWIIIWFDSHVILYVPKRSLFTKNISFGGSMCLLVCLFFNWLKTWQYIFYHPTTSPPVCIFLSVCSLSPQTHRLAKTESKLPADSTVCLCPVQQTGDLSCPVHAGIVFCPAWLLLLNHSLLTLAYTILTYQSFYWHVEIIELWLFNPLIISGYLINHS